MGKFIEMGTTYRPQASGLIVDMLPGGNYLVQYSPIAGFYLERVADFCIPAKIYGDVVKDADRIINTFWDRPQGLGILLSGEKGSGKTLLTKIISALLAQQGVPTLLINEPYTGDGFNMFLSSLNQPHCILFDEYEKVYDDKTQPGMLTVLDGVFVAKRLAMLTCNDVWRINSHMKNRPGRIYYSLGYTGLDQNFVHDYTWDNLLNKDHVESVVNASMLFSEFNFDMMQALIEEMNRYGESAAQALRMLNCKPSYQDEYTYDITLKRGSTVLTGVDKRVSISPMKTGFGVEYQQKDEDGGVDWAVAHFSPVQLLSVNPQTRELTFVNGEGIAAILKRYVAKPFGSETLAEVLSA